MRIVGAAVASFFTLLAVAENIEKYLIGPVPVWLTLGPVIAMIWVYELSCAGGGDDGNKR